MNVHNFRFVEKREYIKINHFDGSNALSMA